MAESNTRFFRDQRYPDQLISLEQLKKSTASRLQMEASTLMN